MGLLGVPSHTMVQVLGMSTQRMSLEWWDRQLPANYQLCGPASLLAPSPKGSGIRLFARAWPRSVLGWLHLSSY